MRYVVGALIILSVVLTIWMRPVSGPPELVVTRFLQSAQRENWGIAQAYLTRHITGRLGQEGIGGTERFVASRLEPFRRFDIVRVTPREEETDVLVRLILPVAAVPGGHSVSEPPGRHGHRGRIEGDQFVHAHRFQLQREGRAWRIYQFEEVEAP
ncbi:MAG TPA: hypothetical protein VI007_11950 [bacterium]